MNMAHRTNRHHPRYPFICHLKGSACTPQVPAEPPKRVIRGQVQDISAGGLCLLTKESMEVSYLLRGEIFFPESPAPIPTLMRVQWSQESLEEDGYRIGLQFLI